MADEKIQLNHDTDATIHPTCSQTSLHHQETANNTEETADDNDDNSRSESVELESIPNLPLTDGHGRQERTDHSAIAAEDIHHYNENSMEETVTTGAATVSEKSICNPVSLETKPFDLRQPLGAFDYEDLQARYTATMDDFATQEQALWREFDGLMALFQAWAVVGTLGEEGRAGKRLKTRMQFVEMHEGRLEVKRKHYATVVAAFEQALALLGQ